MISKESTPNGILTELLDAARQLPPMTARQTREQCISFAYGNVALHNPAITREMVEAEYENLHPSMEPTPEAETAELRSMAADWKRQCDQLRSAIAEQGGTTGYGDSGQVTVAWPAAMRQYGIKHVTDGDESPRSEADARFWSKNYPHCYRLISRIAPGPWQDS